VHDSVEKKLEEILLIIEKVSFSTDFLIHTMRSPGEQNYGSWQSHSNKRKIYWTRKAVALIWIFRIIIHNKIQTWINIMTKSND